MINTLCDFIGRVRADGHVAVLDEDGLPATRLPHVGRPMEFIMCDKDNVLSAHDTCSTEEVRAAMDSRLNHIAALCGHPDAAQGCRNVLDYIAAIRNGEEPLAS